MGKALSASARALVVEDSARVARLVERALEREGFEIDMASDGETGLKAALANDYDVILLDVRLPGMDGFEVVRAMRENDAWDPVLMLTGRAGVADRVEGLRSGADDYLPKPFAVQELLARVHALVRRGSLEADDLTVLQVGDLKMDLLHRRVTRDGALIELTPREFELLKLLLRNAGQVMSREVLFAGAWNEPERPESNVVDVYIGYLRDKIDRPFGTQSIETVRGVGYRLQVPDEPAG